MNPRATSNRPGRAGRWWLLWLALLAAGLNPAAGARDFNVLDYGAAGDGRTLDTAAIQRAINAASAAGGRVVVPRGRTFLTGGLRLGGGMEFHPAGDLLISTNPADYAGDEVLRADRANGLSLTGRGAIHGRSLAFMTVYDPAGEWWRFKPWRPKMFAFIRCTNLVVRDITFGDAPYWGMHLLGCERVLIERVRVNNRLDVPNCDGIDPDHCREVEIRDCRLTGGDDGIVVKSTRQTNDFGDCSRIYVHDCVIRTRDAGLKIGTETTGDIHDARFARCRIEASSRGLCIQLRDEGDIYHIQFQHILLRAEYHADPWWGRGEAVSFTVIPRRPGARPGRLQDVELEDIRACAENSVRIRGSPGDPITGVTLRRVAVRLGRWTRYPGGMYDNRPTLAQPDLEPHTTAGFSVEQAAHVSLEDCTVSWEGPCPAYFGSALETEQVQDLRLDRFSGRSAHPASQPAVWIR